MDRIACIYDVQDRKGVERNDLKFAFALLIKSGGKVDRQSRYIVLAAQYRCGKPISFACGGRRSRGVYDLKPVIIMTFKKVDRADACRSF